MYGAVTSNEDEGIDIDDHGAASLSPADNINGVSDDDFSDAGRCVRPSVHAGEHSVMSHQWEFSSFVLFWVVLASRVVRTELSCFIQFCCLLLAVAGRDPFASVSDVI